MCPKTPYIDVRTLMSTVTDVFLSEEWEWETNDINVFRVTEKLVEHGGDFDRGSVGNVMICIVGMYSNLLSHFPFPEAGVEEW